MRLENELKCKLELKQLEFKLTDLCNRLAFSGDVTNTEIKEKSQSRENKFCSEEGVLIKKESKERESTPQLANVSDTVRVSDTATAVSMNHNVECQEDSQRSNNQACASSKTCRIGKASYVKSSEDGLDSIIKNQFMTGLQDQKVKSEVSNLRSITISQVSYQASQATVKSVVNTRNKKCYQCGRYGHKANDCRSSRANRYSSSLSESSSRSSSSSVLNASISSVIHAKESSVKEKVTIHSVFVTHTNNRVSSEYANELKNQANVNKNVNFVRSSVNNERTRATASGEGGREYEDTWLRAKTR